MATTFSAAGSPMVCTTVLELKSELTPDEMATAQGILSSPQFDSEQFLEGTRYYFTEIIPAEQAAYGVDTELGESYFVRGLTLVATKWTGEAPNGYTSEVIENLK
jgi:hypothetical protein